MADNKFNISVFDEVRPTYVGPPIEDMRLARETLTHQYDVNEAESNMLTDLFSDTITRLGEDPDGIRFVEEHIGNFKNTINNITEKRGFAYASNDIRKAATKFAGDYRIKNRIASAASWDGQKEAMSTNEKINYRTKLAMLKSDSNSYKFDGDDETGVWNKPSFWMPVEDVDVNAKLMDILKGVIGDVEAGASIKFYDQNGKEVLDPSQSIYNVAVEGKSSVELVEPIRLNELFKSAINNDPTLRDFIFQENAVNQYFNNGADAVGLLRDAASDPDKYAALIDKAANGLANGFSYRRAAYDKNIVNVGLFDTSSGSDTGIGATEDFSAYTSGKNTPTLLTDRESLNQQKNIIDDTLKSNIKYAVNPDTNSRTPILEDGYADIRSALLSDDPAEVARINKDYGIDYDVLYSTRAALKDASIKSTFAVSKERNIKNEVNKNGVYDVLLEEPKDESINYFKSLGYDYSKYEGSTPYHKVVNMLKDVSDKERRATMQGVGSFSTNAPMVKEFTNSTLANNYNSLTSKYSTSNNKYRNYNKEFEALLTSENKPTDGVISTQLPIFNYKTDSKNREVKDKIENSFKNNEFMRGVRKFTSDNKEITDDVIKDGKKSFTLSWLIDNADDITLNSSNVAITGAPRSYAVTYKVDKRGDEDAKSYTIYVPFGKEAGGISSELITQLTSNNYEYRADDILNEYLYSNIPGTGTIDTNLDVEIHRDVIDDNAKGKKFNSDPVFFVNGNVASKETVRSTIANQLQKDEMQFAYNTGLYDVKDKIFDNDDTLFNKFKSLANNAAKPEDKTKIREALLDLLEDNNIQASDNEIEVMLQLLTPNIK